jgi:hypothetical protein
MEPNHRVSPEPCDLGPISGSLSLLVFFLLRSQLIERVVRNTHLSTFMARSLHVVDRAAAFARPLGAHAADNIAACLRTVLAGCPQFLGFQCHVLYSTGW